MHDKILDGAKQMANRQILISEEVFTRYMGKTKYRKFVFETRRKINENRELNRITSDDLLWVTANW